MSVLSGLSYNRESTPEANISKTNPSTVMLCGSLSQGFAECLQKETKQMQKRQPRVTCHIRYKQTRQRRRENGSNHTQHKQNQSEVLLLLSAATGRSRSEGGHSEPHRLRKTVPPDHRRFTELGQRCGRFLLERILSLLFPLWFKKLHPSNLLNICFSELSFRLCSALLHYNNLGSPSSSHSA